MGFPLIDCLSSREAVRSGLSSLARSTPRCKSFIVSLIIFKKKLHAHQFTKTGSVTLYVLILITAKNNQVLTRTEMTQAAPPSGGSCFPIKR